MKIAIGSDHAGYIVKDEIIKHFKNYEFINLGTNTSDSVDYPDYAKKVADCIVHGSADFGILICGTGIGMSIAANKIKGIRCALIYNLNTAKLAKEHNNANIIAIGAREFKIDDILKMIKEYINAKFEERHQRRLNQIYKLEKEK